MSQIIQPSLSNELQSFKDEYGEELEACSYYAFDQLMEMINSAAENETREKFQEFLWDFADELDACNPDAFDVIYDLAQKLELEVY